MLSLRPPGLEFRTLCLEGSVISLTSPSSGGESPINFISHPLHAENCDSNSRLVVGGDCNTNYRLHWDNEEGISVHKTSLTVNLENITHPDVS